MLINNLVIMAAGRGERMNPLTQIVPKAMVPVHGIPLISHNLSSYKAYIKSVHVTVGYKAGLLSQYLLANHDISSIISTAGHGNAWWISNSLLSLIDEPVLVMTCDNVVDLDLGQLIDSYFSIGSPACMLVPVSPVEGIAGDYIFSDRGLVKSLSRNSTSDYYCSGIQLLNPRRICAALPAGHSIDDFSDLWSFLIEIRKLYVAPFTPTFWRSYDTISQLASP